MNTKLNILAGFVLLAALLGGNTGLARAAEGDLDATFGMDGRLVTDTSSYMGWFSGQYVSTQQSDGKIIVGGYYLPAIAVDVWPQAELARYSADGALDEDFGTGGKIHPQAPDATGSHVAGVYTGPQDEIIAVGGYGVEYGGISRLYLARYNSDGTLVEGFGTDGVLPVALPADWTMAMPFGGALQSDGMILVAGMNMISTVDQDGQSRTSAGSFLMRLDLADGTLDPTFGSDGLVLNTADQYSFGQITLQSDGKILVTNVMSSTSLIIHRFTSAGVLDQGFGTDGVLQLPAFQCSALAEGPGGKLYLTVGPIGTSDTTGSNFFLASLNADGSPDPTFGAQDTGSVFTDFAGGDDQSCALLVEEDGKIMVGGGAVDAGGNPGFGLARYTSDGMLDESFGNDGKVIATTVLPSIITELALTPGGKLLATGLIFDEPNVYTVLARYELSSLEPGLTIGPDTLPAAVYRTAYSQQLTASGGTEPYAFSVTSGTLPDGITLSPTGLLSGYTNSATPGDFPITIQVQDAAGGTGSRDYNFVLDKATPTISVWTSMGIYWGYPFNIAASALAGSFYIGGTVDFAIDGVPVAGCQDVAYQSGYFLCVGVSLRPDAGVHTLTASLTPADASFYNAASGSGSFTVEAGSYHIIGNVFKDDDQDGQWNYETEYSLSGWTINLTTCDGDPVTGTNGNVIGPAVSDWSGYYQFWFIPGGQCVRLSEVVKPGYQPTTDTSKEFTLSQSVDLLNFGNYYPTITLSPGVLPYGNKDEAYSQTFTASGGASPYVYTIDGGNFPAGMTLSSEGALSGTPTLGGAYGFSVRAEDVNQAAGVRSYSFIIKTDGNFTLTSSSNPSAPGEAVTFTVSATGEAFMSYPNTGVELVYGNVTFFADGNPIEGCSELDLNIVFDEYGYHFGNYPATCTTAALTEGTHQITATYTGTEVFYTPTLALTQQVGQVQNTAPVANPGGPYLGPVNTSIAFDGSLSSDAEGDPLSYAWTFGDGGTSMEATPSHSYTAAGIYDVCLTVNDGALDSTQACTIAVVYDPAGGFVTGGGWIMSEAGAYADDPSLAGRATFGFVSRYKKGASVPTGTTAFAFDLAGFEFYSESYEWLVVNRTGNTAQFKGSGTVNGALDPNGNAYKFILWAGDSTPDTFRIRIWWEGADAVENVVYDNDVAQAISAGNIVLHTSK